MCLAGTGSDKDGKASVFRMLQWAISTLLRWPFPVARRSFLFLEWVATLCNAEPHFHPLYISLGKELELPSFLFYTIKFFRWTEVEIVQIWPANWIVVHFKKRHKKLLFSLNYSVSLTRAFFYIATRLLSPKKYSVGINT